MKGRPVFGARWGYLIVFMGTAWLAGCATTDVAPLSGYEPDTLLLEEEENELWAASERLERHLERKDALYRDQALLKYLNSIVARLLSKTLRDPALRPRVRVVKAPQVNAFALPNGALYMTMGLLARLENEAQAATIVGHELVHYLNRHALKEVRTQENTAGIAAVVGIVLAGVTGPVAVQLMADASVAWYSRDLEIEADVEGFRLMQEAGYDPKQAPLVFEHLLQVSEEDGEEQHGVFASHPKLRERRDTMRRLAAAEQERTPTQTKPFAGDAGYMAKVETLRLDNAALDVQRGRHKIAEAAVERHLSLNPRSARAHFLRGEIIRMSPADDQTTARAMAAYRRSVGLPDTPAEAYRELGLMYRSMGRDDEATAAFQQYLSAKPGAADAPIIRSYSAEGETSAPKTATSKQSNQTRE